MSNWTRAHDAHIARECEGLEISTIDLRDGGLVYHDQNGKWMAHYNSDPAAAIRAAEAWRKKEKGRWYKQESAWEYGAEEASPAVAKVYVHSGENWYGTGDSALVQALYRATGGPA